MEWKEKEMVMVIWIPIRIWIQWKKLLQCFICSSLTPSREHFLVDVWHSKPKHRLWPFWNLFLSSFSVPFFKLLKTVHNSFCASFDFCVSISFLFENLLCKSTGHHMFKSMFHLLFLVSRVFFCTIMSCRRSFFVRLFIWI